MATKDPFHDRLLAIVLTLPGAYEDRPWGSVHCKVDGKIFVGWGRGENGHMSLGFRTDKSLQGMLVASDPRFSIAKYVGKYGGVDMDIGPKPNWDEVEQFIVESYRIIAPKKRVKELDAQLGSTEAGHAPKKVAAKRKTTAVKNATAKKPVAKKPTTTKRPLKS